MTTKISFVYDEFRNRIEKSIEESLVCKKFTPIEKQWNQSVLYGPEEADMRGCVDNAFRNVLLSLLQQFNSDNELDKLDTLLDMSVIGNTSNYCSASLPITLLSDLFDCKTIEQCEQLFDLVEKRVSILKTEYFFKNVKNQLLRSCNDLLRRLSKSQNTVFCGRILIFLARFFPLFERSGLNLVSEFNFENMVQVSQEDEGVFEKPIIKPNEDELMLEEGEMPATSDCVDFQFYLKFWSLQEFFRVPTTCYNRISWKKFQANATDVISLFFLRKLDQTDSARRNLPQDDHQHHFSKYLTNQKLLELQLADSNFRRYVLIQFLILFQYLIGRVRFKTETQVLSEEQLGWVNETSDRILTLIEETPPNGRQMRECITQLLTREQFWSNWKNEACAELKQCNQPISTDFKPSINAKIGDEIRLAELGNKIVIGNDNLTRLWNVCPDNWKACQTPERAFMPLKRDYFDNVMKTTEDYEDVFLKDENFTWGALRVLSQQSSTFFTQSNKALQPVKKYLAEAIKVLRTEFKIEQNVSESKEEDLNGHNCKRKYDEDETFSKIKKLRQSEKFDQEEENSNKQSESLKAKMDDISIEDAEDISDDELLKQDEPNGNGDSNQMDTNGVCGESTPKLSSELLTDKSPILNDIADKIKLHWKALAVFCKFEPDIIDFIESKFDKKEAHLQAKHWLSLWIEEQAQGEATLTKLQNCIENAKLAISVL